ncbi:MAG: hypothetical protein ACOYMW_08105 [Candidatus Competibacteraceae bacterium]
MLSNGLNWLESKKVNGLEIGRYETDSENEESTWFCEECGEEVEDDEVGCLDCNEDEDEDEDE